MKKLFIIVLITATAMGASARMGDVLTLTNNMTFRGQVKKVNDCSLVFKTKEGKHIIPAGDVYSVEFEDPTNKLYTEFMEQNSNIDKCFTGKADASNFHGKKGSHFVLGVLFGPFAVIGALIAEPTPEKGKRAMLSKNSDMWSDPVYLNCYTKEAKKKNIVNTAIGWGAWIVTAILLGAVAA